MLPAPKANIVHPSALWERPNSPRTKIPSAVIDRLLTGDAPLMVWREYRRLSQAELARQSGVNRIQIIDIEAGRKTGSAATLKKLATALQVDMDDLFEASDV